MKKIISQYEGSPVYKETLREILLEKMDIEKSKAVLSDIKKGKIKIRLQEGLSYLGELGLVHQFSDVMKPRMPEGEIFLAFKKRLLATRIRLICVNCGGYNVTKRVSEVEDQPECPKCESRLIGVARKRQVKLVDVVNKRLKRKKLTDDELKDFYTLRRTADLVIVYGKNAVITLAGRGIGPQTAARILAMLPPTKEKLYKDILDAERQFVRTKIYWK